MAIKENPDIDDSDNDDDEFDDAAEEEQQDKIIESIKRSRKLGVGLQVQDPEGREGTVMKRFTNNEVPLKQDGATHNPDMDSKNGIIESVISYDHDNPYGQSSRGIS